MLDDLSMAFTGDALWTSITGLVLLESIPSQTVAPGWIWLSGFWGMARLLAAMPWNRVAA